jgi:hypothetical protein
MSQKIKFFQKFSIVVQIVALHFNIFNKISIWVSENEEFDADFESFEKVINTIVMKNLVFFTFISLCKRFWL